MSIKSFFQAMMAESGKLYGWFIGRETTIDSPINAKEVMALIRYAAENGIDSPGPDPEKPNQTTIILLNDALNEYKSLTSQSSSDDKEQQQGIVNATSAILYHYTRLIQSTKVNGHQVNGRTLIDTRNSGRSLFLLFSATMLFALLAITNEILISWVGDRVYSVDGNVSLAYFFKEHIFGQLAPFVWGALGGCIYLSMHLYDDASI